MSSKALLVGQIMNMFSKSRDGLRGQGIILESR